MVFIDECKHSYFLVTYYINKLSKNQIISRIYIDFSRS